MHLSYDEIKYNKTQTIASSWTNYYIKVEHDRPTEQKKAQEKSQVRDSLIHMLSNSIRTLKYKK